MQKKKGGQSVIFQYPVTIKSTASIVGPKEGQGPLRDYFDLTLDDVMAGQKTWEKAESKIVEDAMNLAVKNSGFDNSHIDFVIAGDLLNQSTATTFGVMGMKIPLFGIFGACSTFGEGLGLGAMLIDGGFAKNVLVGASSHFCSAERQFRSPLELGGQRPPTASWTVTGAGCAVLSNAGEKPYITGFTAGRVIDMGITDANNMGAAMAPAVVDTLVNHFKDFNRNPAYYDVIATGDLGYIGHELVVRLMSEEGFNMSENYTDCGIQIFDRETQDTHVGGSGCGCSASAFSGYYYKKIKQGEIKSMLLIPTGALLSQTSQQQGSNIPGIAHAVVIESSRQDR
ncbi:MAG: stage V sporulation protein AD [Clostridiales bacterium]|jgi:stage V sporulation protein AD|nr:stage V sporulation protein AD [Clostridiales bacterium]